jgi:glutamyl-tRNA reductase
VRLVAVGLSHHRAAFGLLGRVALHETEARCLLQNVTAAGAREAAVISTCNRT